MRVLSLSPRFLAGCFVTAMLLCLKPSHAADLSVQCNRTWVLGSTVTVACYLDRAGFPSKCVAGRTDTLDIGRKLTANVVSDCRVRGVESLECGQQDPSGPACYCTEKNDTHYRFEYTLTATLRKVGKYGCTIVQCDNSIFYFALSQQFSECGTNILCPDGFHGVYCNETCGHCVEGRCERDFGHCASCQSGFKPTLCTDCVSGRYGDRCDQVCDTCAYYKSCDRKTGVCGEKCPPAFKHPACKECVAGFYSWKCLPCGRCANGAPCNVDDGSCNQGCSPGFKPPKCTDCVFGRYGAECDQVCDSCANLTACDRETGDCAQCPPGFELPSCKDCDFGRYGAECDQVCDSCANLTACDRETGDCEQCPPGFKPPFCKDCPPGQQGKDCDAAAGNLPATSKLRIAGIASGTVIGCICLKATIMYIIKARAGRGEGPSNPGKRKEPTSALKNSQQASPPEVTTIAPEQGPSVALPLSIQMLDAQSERGSDQSSDRDDVVDKTSGSQESSQVDSDESGGSEVSSPVDSDVSSVATSLASDSSAY